MRELSDLFGLGLEAQRLSLGQVSARAVVVFFSALFIVRLADKRFFAKKTAFDVILGFMLASMLARTINGSEQLVPTIVAGLLLALLHRLLGMLACRWPRFGDWIKGSSQTVITNGQIDHAALRRHHIGEDDLGEELRLNGVDSVEKVKLARLERSGEVSVVKN